MKKQTIKKEKEEELNIGKRKIATNDNHSKFEALLMKHFLNFILLLEKLRYLERLLHQLSEKKSFQFCCSDTASNFAR